MPKREVKNRRIVTLKKRMIKRNYPKKINLNQWRMTNDKRRLTGIERSNKKRKSLRKNS